MTTATNDNNTTGRDRDSRRPADNQEGSVPIRVKNMQWMRAGDIMDNAGNWRVHPDAQKRAMGGVLKELGIAGALLAYNSARQGGLVLIDGHERKDQDHNQIWPVLVTDLNDEEADKLLALYDPLSQMATMDGEAMRLLTSQITTDDLEVRELLRKLEEQADAQIEMGNNAADAAANGYDVTGVSSGPPDMKLMPFEHYDYVMLAFKKTWDWSRAVQVLGLEKAFDPRAENIAPERRNAKVGLNRVVDGAWFIDLIQKAQKVLAESGDGDGSLSKVKLPALDISGPGQSGHYYPTGDGDDGFRPQEQGQEPSNSSTIKGKDGTVMVDIAKKAAELGISEAEAMALFGNGED